MVNQKNSFFYPSQLHKYFILFLPYLIAFFSSMAIMMIELVAGRIVGSHLGNSFYTWAAIIAVTLFGNSLGNYLGGKVAERRPPFQLLSKILIMAALSCLLTLLLNRYAGYTPLTRLDWPIRIFTTVFILFTLPTLFLGAITPVTAKLALEYSAKIGVTIGNIYAWGAFGSISGTLLTGFFFIAILGSMQILLLIVVILTLLAILLFSISKQNPNAILLLTKPLNPKNSSSDIAEGVQPLFKPASWKYTPRLLVFYSSTGLMMIELAGGRLISRYFGNSLFSWTSIIGVVLAGMSIGYFIGGRLSERPRPENYLNWLFEAASILTLLALIIINYLWISSLLAKLSLPWQVFLTVLFTMLLPAAALGAISPLTCRLALKYSPTPTTAFTIGSMNAWAITGSILGTLSAGFWLISAFRALGVLLTVTLSLALIAWWLHSLHWLSTTWLLIIVFVFWAAIAPPRMVPWQAVHYTQILGLRPETHDLLFAKDSKYQYVKVYQNSKNSQHDIRTLALDSLIHGYYDLKNPANLQYEYEHIYQHITRCYAANNIKPKAFFIGAGSYTFPRWMLFQWPKAQIDVAEIDPVVVEANYHSLGLPKGTPIHTFIGDARNVISNLPLGAKYDFFYGDAFNDFSVPWHLTTLEFVHMVKDHMNPHGAYLLNIIDNYDNGLLVGSSYLTLKKAFRHVYVVCTNPLRIQNLRDTFILVASDVPIDTAKLASKSSTADDGVLLMQKNLDYLTKRCNGLILTDNFAPIENLLAPVVSRRRLK